MWNQRLRVKLRVKLEIQEWPGQEVEGQVQVHRAEEESSESDLDRFIQGEIAPPLTRKEQVELARNGIFLVVATNITGELFITQLAEKYYTKEEQKDIRR